MPESKTPFLQTVFAGVSFIILFSCFSVLLFLKYSRNKRHLIMERQLREARFEQELLQAQLEMQEDTLKTISRDIHDNVGQILSIAKINLNILAADSTVPPRVHEVKTQVTDAIRELRNLSEGYQADRLSENGLMPALQYQLQQLDRMGLFTITLRTEMGAVPVGSAKALMLFRITQEAFNNIVRHAGATAVTVEISMREGLLHISIQDNGHGFDTSAKDFRAGLGLASMRHRAAMIGGEVSISSIPSRGTIIHLTCKPDLL
jgi:signal transduction histidine kinase